MPFVKLDTGILNSTLWVERECRELFITALLMAEPQEFLSETPQIAVRGLEMTGWMVPPGWYGFVPAAGVGIIRRAIMDQELGMVALERLCAPDPESRSGDYEGRRMARIDGGYLVLNYMKYRDRDYTAAERQRRYRLRKLNRESTSVNIVTRNDGTLHRDITQAEVEAEVYLKPTSIAPSVPLSANGIESIPLKGGFQWEVPHDFLAELDRLYPNVDPKQTLREIRGWCIGNEDRQKTKRGVKKFIVGWFAREQDKHGRAK